MKRGQKNDPSLNTQVPPYAICDTEELAREVTEHTVIYLSDDEYKEMIKKKKPTQEGN